MNLHSSAKAIQILVLVLLTLTWQSNPGPNNRIDSVRAFRDMALSSERIELVWPHYEQPGASPDIFFEIHGKSEIRQFCNLFSFDYGKPTGSCLCEGGPEIRFITNDQTVEIATLQHFTAVRWRGFLPDADLTLASSRHLYQFLNAHRLGPVADSYVGKGVIPTQFSRGE